MGVSTALILSCALFAGSFELGLDISGLTAEQIEYYMPQEGGGSTVIFAKSVAPLELYEGVYLWSEADKRLKSVFGLLDASPNGGRVIVEESYTPRSIIGWYGTAQGGAVNNRGVNHTWYGNKMQAMVYRWGSGGIVNFGSRCVSEWGLWNEPDGIGLMCAEGESHMTAFIAYCDAASIAAQRIRLADPTAVVISGGFLSPSSDRNPAFSWEDLVENRMWGMFGHGSGTFYWPVAPDVLHWHPYDAMEYDEGNWADREDFYDPLVMDPWDLMYLERADDLPGVIDGVFPTGDPDWESMPQFCLEYCPTYSLDYWRQYNHPSEIPDFEQEFYSYWRANYQVVSSLCLLESDRDMVLAPQVPLSQWWVEDWKPFGLYNVPAGDGTCCDTAWKVFTSRLLDMDFQSATSAGFDGMRLLSDGIDGGRSHFVKVWHFIQESSISDPSLYVLRTCRTDWNDYSFNPDQLYMYDLDVGSSTARVDLYNICDEYMGSYSPVNGIVSLPVNAYIRYAVAVPVTPHPGGSQADPESFTVTASSGSGEIRILSSAPCSSVNLIDMAGRLIERLAGDETGTSFSVSSARLPSGVYFILAVEEHGDGTASTKVVILR